MNWSTIRNRYLAQLAPALSGRLDVHVTGYDRGLQDRGGRGWFTYDGVEVVSISLDVPNVVYRARIGRCLFGVNGSSIGCAVATELMTAISEVLSCKDVTVRGVGLLDKRAKRAHLSSAMQRELHPFESILLAVRRHAEGKVQDWAFCPFCRRPILGTAEERAVGPNCDRGDFYQFGLKGPSNPPMQPPGSARG